MNATRAAPATSGAFAAAVTRAPPPRVPADRSEAWAVPSASTRQADTRRRPGAELATPVQRLSSVRGRRTSEITVPGRTHNCRRTASPGATETSTRPAAQPPAEGAADREGEAGAGLADEGPDGCGADAEAVEGGADLGPGVPAGDPAEGSLDGPPAAPPPPAVPHAASTSTAAIAYPPAHHRIPVPPCP
ncbi:hypothetical protein [Streptomyces humi]|uniref:hypothetical protein n=1 Tax=Streptomyces humi TaxID=1428620 RepID=UPI00142DA3E9|nr:hypothetical protein [Streptomyces humi]